MTVGLSLAVYALSELHDRAVFEKLLKSERVLQPKGRFDNMESLVTATIFATAIFESSNRCRSAIETEINDGHPPMPWTITVTNKRPFEVEDLHMRV